MMNLSQTFYSVPLTNDNLVSLKCTYLKETDMSERVRNIAKPSSSFEDQSFVDDVFTPHTPYAPYNRVAKLCEEMNTVLLEVESGELLADLLVSIALVTLKVDTIITRMKEDEEIKKSTEALELERENG